ncbi:shwachman-Bodian-diamond syndrome protein [Bisporella sp. PMI_857]|nr:shwachman-Bodian-diamond syndrome protein [Bisporella sp. PMI_857]
MVKGATKEIKVHYKGKDDDFLIYIEDAEKATAWKTDKTIPLVDVVNSFKVFTTGRHGAQGALNTASNATLENEFGTSKDDEVIKKILEAGDIQETKGPERQGNTNDSKGSRGV